MVFLYHTNPYEPSAKEEDTVLEIKAKWLKFNGVYFLISHKSQFVEVQGCVFL